MSSKLPTPDTETDVPFEIALARARREGADAARAQGRRNLVFSLGMIAALVITAFGVTWHLAGRAQTAAPQVIEQIVTQRRDAVETRFAERSEEAQQLTVELFTFLQRLWIEIPTLARMRAHVDGATTQVRLLTSEVYAAIDSPRRNGRALWDNGPTRANAVLDHALAVAAELRRLVPTVMSALQEARAAVSQGDEGLGLTQILGAIDALLEPFIADDPRLQVPWEGLRADILAWVERVRFDLEMTQLELDGDALTNEFMRRLGERVF